MLQRKKKFSQKINYSKSKKPGKESKGNGKKLLMIYTAFIVLIGFIVILNLSQSIKINNLNYRLEELEREHTELQNDNEDIRFQISNLSSLSRVENIARSELNMDEPQQIAYIDLRDRNKDLEENKQDNRFFVFKFVDEVVSSFTTVSASDNGE